MHSKRIKILVCFVYCILSTWNWDFLGGTSGKELRLKGCGFSPWVRKIPGGGHDNHSSNLAWKIPWTEEPDRSPLGSQSQTRLKWLSMHTHVHEIFLKVEKQLYQERILLKFWITTAKGIDNFFWNDTF